MMMVMAMMMTIMLTTAIHTYDFDDDDVDDEHSHIQIEIINDVNLLERHSTFLLSKIIWERNFGHKQGVCQKKVSFSSQRKIQGAKILFIKVFNVIR